MERGRTRRPFLRSVRQLADALGLAAPERAQLIAAAQPAVGLAVAAGVGRADGQGFVLPVPRQLPSGVARFTGRAAELDMLAGLAGLAIREAGTAVVISGTAGVGKTALACTSPARPRRTSRTVSSPSTCAEPVLLGPRRQRRRRSAAFLARSG